ncbi:MAG TPA: heterodisulfide reductase-related iron-sulfur binding cluster [Bryobacteraceae bacterium]|nr:heterodisulfide reductase-related iron-sulfur binding cluster [Bryobacteraceae bacterium]
MHHPAWWEVVIFLVLGITSLVVFSRRLSPVLVTILRSKPDPGWTLSPIGKRVWDFTWEVLLQAKVIRERPVAGIAHAFVFWGFLAFAFVTLNHFASALGLGFLSIDSFFGRVYFTVVAIFALAVLASIGYLAWRRFVEKPRWLGSVSVESGIIAGLIAALMITYLVSLYLPESSVGGRVNWWLHTLALLVFLPLIPKTKHLHLLLSPMTIFLSRGGFSKIRPLVGDEDFGIITGKDLTQIDALQVFSCVECGRCTEHCPANNTGKVLDPKKIALGVRQYLRDNGPNSEVPIVGNYVLEEALFQCTSCGACEYQCPVGIEHLPLIIGMRRGRVNTGEWEDEYGGKLFHNLERNGNSLGFGQLERDKFIKKAQLPLYDGTQDYCLWLGCMGAYDPRGREIIESFAEVMRHIGKTFGVLKKEKCTGDPVRRLGNDYLLGQLAEFNQQQIQGSRATLMVSICPHCVRTMTEDWKEFGIDVTVEHHSEFLARNLNQLPAGTAERLKVAFHDPCYLGRYRGKYDEPRSVIDLVGHETDPERSRERSFCCGAGGGLAFLGEEQGKRVSIERAEQLLATGAHVIGAACPFCNTMFRDALVQLSPTPPKLLDIAQIAASAIPKGADAAAPDASARS